MNAIVFEGQSLQLADGESLLDGLLREGHTIPNGCRSGVCQSCLLSSDDSDSIASAQAGLSAAQKQLNYFLSCQCIPKQPLTVRRVDAAANRVSGTVVSKDFLNSQVIQLCIQADIDYLPGQYVTLWKDDSLARSYSLASLPSDMGIIELHIRLYADGQFSSWVGQELEIGDGIDVQGPLGSCVYSPCADQPLLLAAMGTGFAPIWGIVRDALQQGHSAPIELVVGARDAEHFYLLDELQLLAQQHPNLSVHLLCENQLQGHHRAAIEQADAYQYCASQFPSLKGYRIFVCGGQNFVTKLRKQCFMAGANMKDISADIFIPFSS